MDRNPLELLHGFLTSTVSHLNGKRRDSGYHSSFKLQPMISHLWESTYDVTVAAGPESDL